MLNLVTITRLVNVISKFGRVKNQDRDKIKKLVDLLGQDVIESFNEEYESIFNALSLETRNHMMVNLYQASTKLVDNYFK